ncbi:MAG: DUF2812 domain-containing protein [Coriobacteriales bacterium]|jgi:hypothetical protein|nr:DUF2812 domain-containing protein [Coriobacteriales bacterium]
MQKTIHKLFWLWDFDKEEAWLNEMAAKGLVLAEVGYARYVFEDKAPGAYQIRLEMLQKQPSHPESQDYIRFLEETGAEHIGTFYSWVYFRKNTNEGSFDLFSDVESRIKHLNRILVIPSILLAFTLLNSYSWIDRYIENNDAGNLAVALLLSVLSLFMMYAFIRLFVKRLKLKKDSRLYE